MTDDEVEALLTELEAALQDDVRAALALTVDEFVAALDGATELTAARFSVSGIRDMWRRRVGPLMDRLRGVTGRAAEAVADDLGTELPDGWDEPLTAYVEATEALLDAIGDRLAAEATEALAQGLNAGESVDELKDRLAAVFAADGAQLGEGRAARIAMTEATRAWNAGTLAAAQALTGPDRPLVKQWLTRNDERVRAAHREVNGQLQLLDDPFDVAGTPMLYPGDPTAPAALTVGCRCILRTATAPERTASMGEVADVLKEMAAAAEVHTGAMIALVPTDADAQRLALEGGEVAEQLHTTLFFLGKAADWTDEQRGDLISRIARAATYLEPINARIFGAAQWNPTSDEPAWVWSVGNDRDNDSGPYGQLESARYETTWALEDGHDDPQLPPQHTPWVAHITAAYSSDDWRERMQALVGPLTFDRIRVAFGGQNTDIPLSGAAIYADDFDEPVAEPVEYEEPPQLLTWSTPDGTALAFENQQTGDGRVFAPGALYWDDGPWPLQYADEMNGGHGGARLAGAIYDMNRNVDLIKAFGVLYVNTSAGVEAAMLLAQGAPLGVSVDLDSVDLELVDRTAEAEAAYHARLVTASLLPLADGGWHLTGETAAEWTASGTATVSESARVDIVVGPDGSVPASAFQITAAAGDSGDGGVVVETQLSDSYLMRITRARVRGATLVSIPAYSEARIVLDDASMFATAVAPEAVTAAARNTSPYERVVRHVRKSLIPVTAGEAARFLRVPVSDVRRYLARAAKKGTVVRIAHGRYVPATQAGAAAVAAAVAPTAGDVLELTASATGRVDLPVADRDTPWDGPSAIQRIQKWASSDGSGDPETIDWDKYSEAFAYRRDAVSASGLGDSMDPWNQTNSRTHAGAVAGVSSVQAHAPVTPTRAAFGFAAPEATRPTGASAEKTGPRAGTSTATNVGSQHSRQPNKDISTSRAFGTNTGNEGGITGPQMTGISPSACATSESGTGFQSLSSSASTNAKAASARPAATLSASLTASAAGGFTWTTTTPRAPYEAYSVGTATVASDRSTMMPVGFGPQQTTLTAATGPDYNFGDFKLPFADVLEGTLTIVPRGVFAAQAAMEGARGGVDIPSDEVDAVKAKLTAVRAHVDEVTGGKSMDDMQASAWTAMRDLPPMPASWFAEPTDEELPPGGAGVNYANGRVFGWVAQAGEPHAGFAKKITIDGLGKIDTTHFLRQRFTLDDGSSVKAGAFTMNVGHHRDGAECETSACQFDDTRTVAGIVTVGMNARGMWFSGAAAPWMSEWDRSVFAASQPSYHMRKGPNGNWQLRAVLSVPVPGHSSPLMASAVVDRSNLALTASATMLEVEEAVAAAETASATAVAPHDVAAVAPEAEGIDYDRLADSLVAAMARADERKAAEAAELEALMAEAAAIELP